MKALPKNVTNNFLKIVIIISLIVGGVSALMDATLWWLYGFTVPSWTISGMLVGFMMLLMVMYNMMNKQRETEGKT